MTHSLQKTAAWLLLNIISEIKDQSADNTAQEMTPTILLWMSQI